MRIAILGNSGSGKSTLAHQLVRAHQLVALDLDTVAWEPGQIAVAREPQLAVAEVRHFCASTPRWVVEGCYGGLIRESLRYASLLLFLEPGADICRANCHDRPWEPHKFKSAQEQDRHFDFLLQWVDGYYRRSDDASLYEHQAVFDGFAGQKHKLTHRASPQFVEQLELQPS
jgi:adenylate kinase family enzyme